MKKIIGCTLLVIYLSSVGFSQPSPLTQINSAGIEMVWISPGSFWMGTEEVGLGVGLERFPQRVTVSEGFWIGRFEVTQDQYASVMGTNPSWFSYLKGSGRHPVEGVIWSQAMEFIKKLNDRNDGFHYSLPTEEEWEYAARAGTATAFAFGNSLSSRQANFNGNYPYGKAPKGPYIASTTPVGTYRPNAWGLYDMHGNVMEWVDSEVSQYNREMGMRMARGGRWSSWGSDCRSGVSFMRQAEFNATSKNPGFNDLGLRIVAKAKRSRENNRP